MLSNHNARQIYLASSLYDCLEDEKLSDIEKLLSKNNADPNILIPDKGISPFHLAIGNENQKFALDVTKMFLNFGGDPNVRTDDGLTPVHIAAAWGRYDILSVLLENGGDPDIKDDEQMSALCYALEENHFNIVQLLKTFQSSTVDGEFQLKSTITLALDKVVISNGDDAAEYFLSKEENDDIAYLKSLEHNPNNYVTEWCQKHNNINNLSDKEIKKNIFQHENRKSFVDRWSTRFSIVNNPMDADQNGLIKNIKIEEPDVAEFNNSIVQSSKSDEYETCSEQKDDTLVDILSKQIKDENKPTLYLSSLNNDFGDIKTVPSNLVSNIYFPNIIDKQNNLLKSNIDRNNGVSLISADFSIITPDNTVKQDSKTYNIFNSTSVKCLEEELKTPKSLNLNVRESIIQSGVLGNKLIQSGNKNNCFKAANTKDNQASSKLLNSKTRLQTCTTPNIKVKEEVVKYGTYKINKTPSHIIHTSKELDKNDPYKIQTKRPWDIDAIKPTDKYGTYKINKNPSENHPMIRDESHINHTNECLIQLSEEYRYTDNEEGVVLIEKRILRTTIISSSEDGSFSGNSSITLPNCIEYDTDSLRAELTTLGLNPGPITKTTKRIYLKRLMKCKKKPQLILPHTEERTPYSIELEKTIRNPSWFLELKPYADLEKTVADQFSTPDPKKRWREGVQKSSFTYLLLDPRITYNLPGRADTLSPEEKWKTFLSAVFYVGKGKRSRPYSHLYQAVGVWNEGFITSADKKVQFILDIWKEQLGVVCLHVFQNVIPVEAFTREAAMIDCLTLKKLKNSKLGDYYGIASTWPHKQKRQLGVYLLYRAMQVFLNEGERQLKPPDIAH